MKRRDFLSLTLSVLRGRLREKSHRTDGEAFREGEIVPFATWSLP